MAKLSSRPKPARGSSAPSKKKLDRDPQVTVGKSASSIRRTRALQIVFGEAPIVHVGGPIWQVPSETQSAVRYAVNMERHTCECAFWRDKRVVCKHMEAVRIYQSRNGATAEAGSRGLPNPYKNPPWYDRLAEQQYHILTLLLQSIGVALTEKMASERAKATETQHGKG